MKRLRISNMLRQLSLLFPSGTAPERPKRIVVRRLRPITRRVIASDSALHEMWCELRVRYYPERTDLDQYVVAWSSRKQKRVLASCNIRARRVSVAQELCEPLAVQWLEAVLYHELCHAVIGEDVATPSGKRLWHGAQFKALERRHPDIPALESWLRSGGWAMAVRSNRSRRSWERRRPPSKQVA